MGRVLLTDDFALSRSHPLIRDVVAHKSAWLEGVWYMGRRDTGESVRGQTLERRAHDQVAVYVEPISPDFIFEKTTGYPRLDCEQQSCSGARTGGVWVLRFNVRWDAGRGCACPSSDAVRRCILIKGIVRIKPQHVGYEGISVQRLLRVISYLRGRPR